jgi:integrase
LAGHENYCMKINELVEDYLGHRFLRPETAKAYRQRAQTFNKRCGPMDISTVTIATVREYFEKLVADKNSGATWNSNRRHFMALWRYALDLGLVAMNPWKIIPAARSVRSPKLVSDEHFALAMREIGRRDSHFKPHRFWHLLTVMLSLTALRRSQIVGLRWRDVLLEDSTPHVICVSETSKTHRRYPVPLCKLAVRALSEWKLESQALWGDAPKFLESQVFNYDLHRYNVREAMSLTTNGVTIFFRRISDVLGVPISAHRIRHRTATQLARLMHPKELMDFLGHTQLSTTAMYLWPELKEQAEAVDKFAKRDAAILRL